MNWNLKLIKNAKLRNKLMIVLVLFILAPLSLSGIIFYGSSSDFAAERTDREAVQVLNLVKNNVDQMLSDIENRMIGIYDHQDIMELLSGTTHQAASPVPPANPEDDDINRILRDLLRGTNDIDSMYLIAPNRKIYFADIKGSSLFKPVLEKHPEWESAVHAADGRVVWLPTYELPPNNYTSKTTHYFPVGMQLKNVTDALQRIGVLMMNVKTTALDNIIEGVQITPNGVLMIADGEGNVIWHHNSDAYSTKLAELPFYKEMIADQRQVMTQKINGDLYRIGMVRSDYNKWYYFSLIPQADLDEQSSSLKRFFVVALVVFAVFFVLLAWLSSHYITKPIRQMVSAMKRIQKDNFGFRLQAQSEDEIGLMQSAFNGMSERINDLIQEVKVISEQEKEAEVRALQAQLNPHFVYNTLDAMNWIAIERNQRDISSMITALSDMMRYAIKPGTPYVTIEEELKWARNYAYLQEIRFEERFGIEFEVDPTLLGCKVPRLLLQPYLENSILHGMENKETGGHIHVAIKEEGGVIRIEIRDNGSGIPEEKMRMIQERSGHGIGIYNLDERLKLEFGPEYGVSVHSSQGAGTTVTIRMPAIR